MNEFGSNVFFLLRCKKSINCLPILHFGSIGKAFLYDRYIVNSKTVKFNEKTRMKTNVFTALVSVLICSCSVQGQSTTPESWPEEHGLIVTYLSNSGESQLRHFPEYPGYENVSGELNDAGIIVSDVPALRFPNPNTVMQSISVDYRKKYIYMYDKGQSTIAMGTGYSKELNINNMDFVELHAPISKRDIKIAVDWLSHTVYWADPGFRWIAAAPGQRDKVEKGYYKIIVRSHVDVLHGIALDPLEAVLCWTDKGANPKIECSDLAGSERRTVVSKHLKSPSGLVADIFGKRIYWLDEYTESLLSATYSGDDPKTIVRIPYSDFFQTDVFRDVLYVTNVYDGDIYVLNKTSGKKLENPISITSHRVYGIAVYGEETQPLKETDHCAARNCDHFCITEKYAAICVCSEGYFLNKITGKCQELDSRYHKAIVMTNATNICLLDIRAFVGSDFRPKCIYTVRSQTAVPGPVSRRKRQVQPTSQTTSSSKQDTSPAVVTTPKTTTTTTPTPTVPPGAFIKKFDMDIANRIIFFANADNKIYKRPIDALIEDESKELIVKAAGNISGLAYDAEDINNLYWCESDTGNVWVINTVSRAAKNITPVDSGIRTAKDIIVLLNKRMLAMITGEYPDMSLQTMTMVDRKLNVLVSGKSDIAAFTYDSEKQIFYYISSRRMYSVSLDGGESTIEFDGLDAGINSLVLYQHYLAWSYENGTDLGFKTHDLLGKTTSNPIVFANTSQVDMKILDIILQTPEHISPCAKDNGGCSQICITRYRNNVMTPVCECRLGYTLENNVNCTTVVVNDNFALVADWTNQEIFQIDLDTQEVHAVSGKGDTGFTGVYYDDVREKVIAGQLYESEMVSFNLNGSNRQVFADSGSDGKAYRFDKDETTGNLYFSAYGSAFIGIITRSGDYVIIYDDFGFEFLNDIVVHPGKGWMYYAVSTFTSNYIGRANMDGSEAKKLIRVSGYPDGLAIDYVNDHVFWSDSAYDTVQQCNLDGLDCVTVVNMTGSGEREEIRDLETDGVYLYYTSYRKDHVVRVELTKPYKREIIARNYGFGKLDTIALYSSKTKNIQPLSEGCRNRNGLGDCSTICLPTPTGRTCACESGLSLKPDGRTCSNIYQCTDVIQQTVMLASGEEAMIDINMDLTCSRYLDGKCNYRCPMNFEPTFDTLLTCTNVGWDVEPNILCKEIRCPVSIKNGQLASGCTRRIDEQCDFECNLGFVKTTEKAFCTENGTFLLSTNRPLCEQFLCDDSIDNGSLDVKCPRTIGTKCEYTCDKFYSPSVASSIATCDATGWSPASTELCKESMCKGNTLGNGTVANDCQGKIGDACLFQCNQGFAKTSSMVFCKNDESWHPKNACAPYTCSSAIENGALDPSCKRTLGEVCNYTCTNYHTPRVLTMQTACTSAGWSPASSKLCESVKCPLVVPNGEIVGECNLTVGSTCNFKCNDGSTSTSSYITCNYQGKWLTDNLCLVKESQKSELSVPGVAIGFVILGVLVIGLVVLGVVLFRRKMTSSTYASFDNNRGGSIALGNPGFGMTA